MKSILAFLGMMITVFTVQAKFVDNLGEPGQFPKSDARLEVLQGILLDSAAKAFSPITGSVTLDTSLSEIRKYRPLGFEQMNVLLAEATSLFQAEGCVMITESNLGYNLYMRGIKSPSNTSGTIVRVSDLLAVLNSRVTCN